jgi:hypothetical protein
MICFGARPLSMDDGCLVADSYELAGDADVPAEAEERGWNSVLIKNAIEDILDDLLAQDADAAPDLILAAIGHYADRDAFIDLRKRQVRRSDGQEGRIE